MRQFTTFEAKATCLVIDFRRSYRYANGEKTDILDSRYTILRNYEQIEIIVADSGQAVTKAQIKEAADTGDPIIMEFTDLEITIRPKDRWEINGSGRASQAVVAKSK